MKSIDVFVRHWATKHVGVPIASDDIAALENQLSIYLPTAYKYLLSRFGLLHSPNVLTKTCHLNVAIAEVQDFLSLDDVSALSRLYEMSGMPKGHILFASDAKGNMFCFNKKDCEKQQQDIPVYYYNHDLHTIESASASFIQWLEQFNEL